MARYDGRYRDFEYPYGPDRRPGAPRGAPRASERYAERDFERGRRGGAPLGSVDPFSGWYPGAYWAGPPMYGWGGLEGWGWPPFAPIGYGAPPVPRRRPAESRAYGRGGDEAARRWAERYGYDIEYTVRPRRRR
jgi:hypothetical protein